jgi:hypothetical protein
MVVRDSEAAMREWIKLGVGPWYVLTFKVDNFRYRGSASEAPEVKLCFAHSGGVQLELIEQLNDVPSAYAEFLAKGREGCQHVSSWFADHASYNTKRQELLARGFTLVHEGGMIAADASFAYFETGEPGGLQFELSETLMPASSAVLERMLRETRDWDGVSGPIRQFA